MTGLPVTVLGDISRIIVLPKGCAFLYGLLKKYRRPVLFYRIRFFLIHIRVLSTFSHGEGTNAYIVI